MADASLLFKDLTILIMDQGLGKTRRQILTKQIEGKGGQICNSLSSKVTHIVANSTLKYERLLTLLKVESIPSSVHVVNAEWISTSIINGTLAETSSFLITPSSSINADKGCGPSKKKVSEFVLSLEASPVKATPATPVTTPTKGSQLTPTKQEVYLYLYVYFFTYHQKPVYHRDRNIFA